MNFFETKTVKLYRHINDYECNYIGEPSPEISYVCDLTVDIQPATAKLLEKEFGMVNEATFILWVESAPNKDFILDKDTYVRFEYEDYKNLYQVVDRSRWIDSFWDDDYTSFSVKLVDNIKEHDYTNNPIIANLEQNEIVVNLNETIKTEITPEEPDEGDDYYG